MDRSEARRALAARRVPVLADEAERAARRTLHGERGTVTALGQEREMLFYRGPESDVPLYVDIHGGGFCWGRVDDGDGFCQRLSERLGFAAASLDYPLIPESSYPEALEWLSGALDALRARATELGFDSQKVVVGGRSAGANLAAALCVLAAERGLAMPICQVLDHPYLDLCGTIPNKGRYAGPHALGPELLDELASAYASDEERVLPTCSPVRASADTLSLLPPAVIQVCEWDSLRQDGELYAEMLAAAGVPVVSHCYPGVFHGFTEFQNDDMIPGQDWLIEGIARLVHVRPKGGAEEGR